MLIDLRTDLELVRIGLPDLRFAPMIHTNDMNNTIKVTIINSIMLQVCI